MRPGHSRAVDKPEPGYFSMKLVKGGPLVGARIIFDGGMWSVEIDGEMKGGQVADPNDNLAIFRVWHGATIIDETEYRFLKERSAWAKVNDPKSPFANPTTPIDFTRHPPIF
jgi:hypothetical protein